MNPPLFALIPPHESTNIPKFIEQEFVAAEGAWKNRNGGKARVFSRQVVALVPAVWLAKQSDKPFRVDALAHLHRIQQVLFMPLPVREATECLSTTVIRKDSAPLTTQPIGDAGISTVNFTAV